LELGKILLDDGLCLFVISEVCAFPSQAYTHLLEPVTDSMFFWSILQHSKTGEYWVNYHSSEEHLAIRQLYSWMRLSEFRRLAPGGNADVFDEQPKFEMATHDKMVPYLSTMHDDIVVNPQTKKQLLEDMQQRGFQTISSAQEEHVKSLLEWLMWDQI
jgi:hypothetical protein